MSLPSPLGGEGKRKTGPRPILRPPPPPRPRHLFPPPPPAPLPVFSPDPPHLPPFISLPPPPLPQGERVSPKPPRAQFYAPSRPFAAATSSARIRRNVSVYSRTTGDSSHFEYRSHVRSARSACSGNGSRYTTRPRSTSFTNS